MLSALKIKPKQPGQSWGQYYESNHLPFGVILFVGGFIFDIFSVADIDDPFGIAQQVFYLVVIGWILYYEIVHASSEWQPTGFAAKLWNFREGFSHFCLGSLLNIYSIFYFKSASLSSSIYFIGLLAALLVLNEIPAFQSKGPVIRLSIWSLCLSSFFVSLIPYAVGFVGYLPFGLSIIASGIVLYFFRKLLERRADLQFRRVNFLYGSAMLTLGLYIGCYFLKLVPPVPLALKTIGIYHKVEKQNGEYILTEERPWWRFWHNGDQMFYAKPGDKIYVYAAIHAPERFVKNTVLFKWSYKDRRNGWMAAGDVPVSISGGRREGFRAVSIKSNYTPGDWRVSIETPEGLEIGRIGLTVEKVDGPVPASAPEGSLSDALPGS